MNVCHVRAVRLVHSCMTTLQSAVQTGPTTVVKISTMCSSQRINGSHRNSRSSLSSSANLRMLSLSRWTGRHWADATSYSTNSIPSIIWRWMSGAGCPCASWTRHKTSASVYWCRQGLLRHVTSSDGSVTVHAAPYSGHKPHQWKWPTANTRPQLISVQSVLRFTSCWMMMTFSDDVAAIHLCLGWFSEVTLIPFVSDYVSSFEFLPK